MYNKLYSTMLSSSIWLEPNHVRVVWVTLMADMDRDGFAHFSAMRNLTLRANVTDDECADAIRVLESPDPNSADPEDGGRRIERVPGGWLVLNAVKYRDIASDLERRESNRVRVQRFRQKNARRNGGAEEPPAQTAQPKTASGSYHKDARSALHILNESSGKGFREVDANLALISRRLEEPGVDLEGVRMMIRRQCGLWKSDEKMHEYLRPETLFAKSKFDSYYAAREMPVTGEAAKATGNRKPFISEIKTVLEAKKEQRNKIRNRGNEDAMGWKAANEADRMEIRKLNQEIGQLINQLAGSL